MRRFIFIFISSTILMSILYSRADSQPITRGSELKEISYRLAERLQARRTQLYHALLKSDKPAQRKLNRNPDIQLMFIGDHGHPYFYKVDNLNAARTISTDDVWPGELGGYSLDGSGTTAEQFGIWDGGGVLTTHREFGGRVTQADSPVGTSSHSTHVAGTMTAAGVDGSARGMSFGAALSAFDWDEDESEMALAAAAGMNVSNHSYGFIQGWNYSDGNWYWYGDISISTTEDWLFGSYSDYSEWWDSIAYYAPYYTIVKSAGNDRIDNGPGPLGEHFVWDSGDWVLSVVTRQPDGGTDGYDCMSSRGCAKNILTVGAVSDISSGYAQPTDVVMNSFSNWGPTDDGRIKPDIVANGISLYSCENIDTSAYGIKSGTSMSTPNVSGSINLLVRHYENTHGGVTPPASTVKAVVIQTADEAGPDPGPDYMFGWGLMNTLEAAIVIEADTLYPERIIDSALGNGSTHQYQLISDGLESLSLTLCWNDPPGNALYPMVDRTNIMLVNDLDIRLEHTASATVYEPYILDRANPADAATTGDNIRDNVEQIHVASPPAGAYAVTVSHKGALASSQHYSLVSSSSLLSDFPQIISNQPAQNALNVSTDGNIAVTFDMDMNPATIDSLTFVVHGSLGGWHTGTYIYDGPSKTATFDPDNDFEVGERVTVTITKGVASTEGTSLGSARVWTFRTAVAGGTGQFLIDSTYAVGERPSFINAADLNADGYPELITGNGDTDDISILFNNGDGTFAPQVNYSMADWGLETVGGDFDRDHDVDLAVASRFGGVYLFSNDGMASFPSDSFYVTGNFPHGMTASDLDGDGYLDLAGAQVNDGNIAVLLNKGDGTFAGSVGYATDPFATAVAAGDIDLDGDIDLVSANGYHFSSSPNTFSVILNNGLGEFGPAVDYAAGERPFDIILCDFNGDGFADIATVNEKTRDVSIFVNNGDGEFGTPDYYTVNIIPYSLAGADVDGDGDVDIITGHGFTRLTVLLNNGAGVFDSTINLTTDNFTWSVVAADLDGDGDIDLGAIDPISSIVLIMLNMVCVDSDGDGFGDPGHPENECLTDNCPSVYNPDQEDSDADSVGDSCDVCPGFDDLVDNDGDSQPDGCDNCPVTYNPDQEDSDADSVGDSCDVCPGFDDLVDNDGDSQPDGCDNCPVTYNPEQEDSDSDSVGDSCDVCPGFDDLVDSDGDSQPDDCDNCPGTYNPAQDDADGDEIGDLCEICGDANGDDSINIGDAVFVINYVFRGGPVPLPLCLGDVNGDGTVNVGDGVYLINYVFRGGPGMIEPCCP